MNYRLRTVTLKLAEGAPRVLSAPADALTYLRPIYEGLDQDREHFVLLALDAQNKVRGFKIVSTGGQSASLVDPKTLFRDALLLGAAAVIVAHNHPSGDPAPSPEDLRLTHRLVQGGALLDVRVHDHLILGEGDRYASLAAEGRMGG